ncbi:class I SAM-dependent methyltransferase [Nonomuraea sp. NPDC049421]|uniref:class I SAM-dependent methyltransferase n=1 Tax=Nonomuraea sp. NPDC049421 TaxID=3155275 RepID=UPI0034247BA7
MPTTSPEPGLPSGQETHQLREVAESFGTEADRYDRARPSYPEPLITRIAGAAPGPDVLDVGCGTGIAARQLQAAGCRVLGVDVDGRMVRLARERGLEAEVAPFETWDARGRRFDAVVAGQTWHWVDPVAGAARAAEVLRPGGRLALFWNVMQPPPAVADAFAEVYRRVLPQMAAVGAAGPALEAYAVMAGKASEGIEACGAFHEPERWRDDWERTYTREEWLDALPTFGGHSRLPAEQREELLAGMGAAVDALGGRFVLPYATVTVTTTLLTAPLTTPRTTA